MSTKERARMLACERVASGTLGVTEAAAMLSISARQMRRSLRRYEEHGDAGLVHTAMGSGSNRSTDPAHKEAVLARVRECYDDFGPTLAAEKLTAEGLEVNHETLRRWMGEAGIRETRPRKATHRSSREPRQHFGELVQMDGSHHDWFEGRRSRCCLMQMVDDATGVRMMLLSEEETTLAALGLLEMWVSTPRGPSIRASHVSRPRTPTSTGRSRLRRTSVWCSVYGTSRRSRATTPSDTKDGCSRSCGADHRLTAPRSSPLRPISLEAGAAPGEGALHSGTARLPGDQILGQPLTRPDISSVHGARTFLICVDPVQLARAPMDSGVYCHLKGLNPSS
jgi:transposase